MTAPAPALRVDGPARPRHTLALAHGAGAPMDSPLLEAVVGHLRAADPALRVVRFEFPYMAARRDGGRRGPPDRQPVLLATWRAAVAALAPTPEERRTLAIGGHSMGGRMASMVADELGVAAVVCLGYPFHPPAHPDRLRIAHLRRLSTPMLVVQGERDPFGGREEVAAMPLAPTVRAVWIPDGDHSLAPRKRSGHTLDDNLALAGREIAGFLAEVMPAQGA